jgi:hypothetical protein
MSRRFLAAGSWVCIACGFAHLLGHYTLVTNPGQNDAERQLLASMKGDRQDFGLGFVRSMFDLMSGFSLAFAVECLGFGALGIVLTRLVPGFPPLLRAVSGVLAVVFGAMTAIAFVYWFTGPLFFLAVAFVCFATAVATAPRGSSPGAR